MNNNELKLSDKKTELLSSAYTMSDMELFIFPELLQALVLSNILSAGLWEWKKNPWFQGIEQMPMNKKIHRLKQFIMDNYTFNLDLETWGLTTKEKEIERFREYISPEVLAESNALFGYEGDKYYFTLDIRKHFGLDNYSSNVIPYWKTETIDAMNAFRHKKHHRVGAGECVSLSALYAAAMYVVLKIPLRDIFIMGTPLHSQNFIILDDGLITNNRRILTKRMWFNGTIISDKARRALENEKVTYVSHITGYIHTLYAEATIEPGLYKKFEGILRDFLRVKMDGEILINFLRVNGKYRKYFQFQYKAKGKKFFITAEKLFEYEHNSKNRIDDTSRNKLFEEIDMDDFDMTEYPGRYIYNDLEKKFNKHTASCSDAGSFDFWREELMNIGALDEMMSDLKKFACISPRLPRIEDKMSIDTQKIDLPDANETSRGKIMDYLRSMREKSTFADLTFYTGRYCTDKEWPYFLKSAIERNPVALENFRSCDINCTYKMLVSMDNESIYGDGQFAQPDEVINFERGDGLEKAFTLADVIIDRNKNEEIVIRVEGETIICTSQNGEYRFSSEKKVQGKFILGFRKYQFIQ